MYVGTCACSYAIERERESERSDEGVYEDGFGARACYVDDAGKRALMSRRE